MSAPTRFSTLVTLLLAGACASGGGGTGTPEEPGPGGEPANEAAPASGADASAGQPASDGPYYSDAQADRGRDAFRSSCTECHDSREFHDTTFRFKWSRRDLGDLYDLVAETMPEDEPGSLSPQTYADILAYVLRLNDFVAGPVELTPDPERLAAISLASIRD